MSALVDDRLTADKIDFCGQVLGRRTQGDVIAIPKERSQKIDFAPTNTDIEGGQDIISTLNRLKRRSDVN